MVIASLAVMLVLLLHAAHVGALEPGKDSPKAEEAALLIEQGKRMRDEGSAEVAKELFRAAILLNPADPEGHRLLAGLLFDAGDCAAAAAEYRAFVQLAPLRSRRGASWDEALLRMATCVRSEHATLELLTSLDARCALDKGVFQDVLAASPLRVELAPGEHLLECVREGHPRESRTLTLGPKETVRVEVAFDAGAASSSDPAVPTEPIPSIPSPDTTLQAGADDLFLPPLPDLPSDGVEPMDPAGSVVAEDPPVERMGDLVAAATLRIETEGTGWSCRTAGRDVSLAAVQELLLDMPVGPAIVTCSHPEAEPIEQQIELAEGEIRTLTVPFVPRNVASEIPVASSPGSAAAPSGEATAGDTDQTPKAEDPAPPAPRKPLGNPGWELAIAAGMGPSLGAYGLGLGLRFGHVGVSLGTGWQPFAAALNYFSTPGGTGFYAGAGFQSVGPTPLFGAARDAGIEIFGSAGLDARPLRHVGVRIGVGLAYNSLGSGMTGPMRLDFAVSIIP